MAAIAVEAQEKAKAAGREMHQVELGLGLGFTPKAYIFRVFQQNKNTMLGYQ